MNEYASFYTNVQVLGNKILYRGIENGRRVSKKLDYSPTLFVAAKTPTKFSTITGNYVDKVQPGSIRDCREFVERYSGIDNFEIFGNQKYEYAFIADQHKDGDVPWSRKDVVVCNIDIETESENGFPEPDTASERITAITCRIGTKFYVFGCGDYSTARSDIVYARCLDEIDLLKRFIDLWSSVYPDILTGWNIKFFDIPYLVNRISSVLGDKFAKRLSPWGIIREKTSTYMTTERKTYVLLGIGVLDYIELYRKFADEGTSRESYRLDYIAHVELEERKLDYSEYGSLHNLYKQDYQKFIEYNIKDVDLVDKLDAKLGLIDLALTLAYQSKSNYDDVFKQVRMWDNIIYNELFKQKKVLPPMAVHHKDTAYAGAYVKAPQIGLHRWIVSFDLTSLYPHLIMQSNIGTDTIVEDQLTDELIALRNSVSIEALLEKKLDTSCLKNYNLSLTPNGQFFRNTTQAFLPKILEKMFRERKAYKDEMLREEQRLANAGGKDKEIEAKISRLKNLQKTIKVCLNSAYGALGSQHFRLFDIRQAEAITSSGQLAIRWIIDKINVYLNTVLKTSGKDYVIASDTDSIYISLDALVLSTFGDKTDALDPSVIISFMDKVCENKLQPFIDKSYGELARYTNAFANKMTMKREALADKGIWVAKKKYALNVYNSEGIQYAEPELKIVGLEMKKSSTPGACRPMLEKAMEIIINGKEKDLIEFVSQFRKDFEKLPEGDIASPRGVNGIEKYTDQQSKSSLPTEALNLDLETYGTGTPIHVRGSILYNRGLKEKKLLKKYPLIKEGEKIKFIYLKEPNPFNSDIIAFLQEIPNEFGIKEYIDYDTQFTKSFLDPLRLITDVIGWKVEEIGSLEDFFM